MKYPLLPALTLFTCGLAQAQPIDLRAGLPGHGVFPMKSFYTGVPVPEMLDTVGTHWSWDLTARTWALSAESADTIWHHSDTISPAQGSTFSAYELNEHRYSFFHLNADTLVEDSSWVLSQNTTEIGYPATPMCWHAQEVGDTLWYFDRLAGVDRMTSLRATLDLKMPWGTLSNMLVFEDRVLNFTTYRIHRREDLVRELARYPLGDGLYLVWPKEP